MGWKRAFAGASVVVAGLAAHAANAFACGGCFVPPDENTQVTGHRMVMSIGKDQSTLYDQIEYSGAPESFAWVLPTKGEVEVGLSSDLLFNQLGFDSQVVVRAPALQCPAYECGPEAVSDDGFGATGSGGGVDVIAQKVVGPYETVQLAATDPEALAVWLKGHGYGLPKDIEPLVGTYVTEGFNFLAVKLVPGAGVQSMQPIRITTKGAAVTLPLRMVSAGTGALTTITLYVVGEGRWATANFPGFIVNPADVLWDYNQDRSNYADVRAAGYANSKGAGWLTESSQPYSVLSFSVAMHSVLDIAGPPSAGYAEDFETSSQLLTEDIATLFAGMNPGDVWLTRLRAELPREALATDLVLAAESSGAPVSPVIQTVNFVGTQPDCPPPPPGCEVIAVNGGAACSYGGSGSGHLAFGGALALLGVALRKGRRRGR